MAIPLRLQLVPIDDDATLADRINAHASSFAKIPLWWILALRAHGAPPATRDVLVVIASYADPKTGEAFPSVSTMAVTLGIRKNAVLVAIRELKEAGILTSTPRNRRSRETNLYRLVYQVSKADTQYQVLEADTNGGLGIQIGDDQVSKVDSDQVPGLCSNGVRNLPVEPTKEPSDPSLRSGSASAAIAADAFHEDGNERMSPGAAELDVVIRTQQLEQRLRQKASAAAQLRRLDELEDMERRAAGGVA